MIPRLTPTAGVPTVPATTGGALPAPGLPIAEGRVQPTAFWSLFASGVAAEQRPGNGLGGGTAFAPTSGPQPPEGATPGGPSVQASVPDLDGEVVTRVAELMVAAAARTIPAGQVKPGPAGCLAGEPAALEAEGEPQTAGGELEATPVSETRAGVEPRGVGEEAFRITSKPGLRARPSAKEASVSPALARPNVGASVSERPAEGTGLQRVVGQVAPIITVPVPTEPVEVVVARTRLPADAPRNWPVGGKAAPVVAVDAPTGMPPSGRRESGRPLGTAVVVEGKASFDQGAVAPDGTPETPPQQTRIAGEERPAGPIAASGGERGVGRAATPERSVAGPVGPGLTVGERTPGLSITPVMPVASVVPVAPVASVAPVARGDEGQAKPLADFFGVSVVPVARGDGGVSVLTPPTGGNADAMRTGTVAVSASAGMGVADGPPAGDSRQAVPAGEVARPIAGKVVQKVAVEAPRAEGAPLDVTGVVPERTGQGVVRNFEQAAAGVASDSPAWTERREPTVVPATAGDTSGQTGPAEGMTVGGEPTRGTRALAGEVRAHRELSLRSGAAIPTRVVAPAPRDPVLAATVVAPEASVAGGLVTHPVVTKGPEATRVAGGQPLTGGTEPRVSAALRDAAGVSREPEGFLAEPTETAGEPTGDLAERKVPELTRLAGVGGSGGPEVIGANSKAVEAEGILAGGGKGAPANGRPLTMGGTKTNGAAMVVTAPEGLAEPVADILAPAGKGLASRLEAVAVAPRGKPAGVEEASPSPVVRLPAGEGTVPERAPGASQARVAAPEADAVAPVPVVGVPKGKVATPVEGQAVPQGPVANPVMEGRLDARVADGGTEIRSGYARPGETAPDTAGFPRTRGLSGGEDVAPMGKADGSKATERAAQVNREGAPRVATLAGGQQAPAQPLGEKLSPSANMTIPQAGQRGEEIAQDAIGQRDAGHGIGDALQEGNMYRPRFIASSAAETPTPVLGSGSAVSGGEGATGMRAGPMTVAYDGQRGGQDSDRQGRRQKAPREELVATPAVVSTPSNGAAPTTATVPTAPGGTTPGFQAVEQAILRETLNMRLHGQNYIRTEFRAPDGNRVDVVLRVIGQQVTVRLAGADAELRRDLEKGWARLTQKAHSQGVRLGILAFTPFALEPVAERGYSAGTPTARSHE